MEYEAEMRDVHVLLCVTVHPNDLVPRETGRRMLRLCHTAHHSPFFFLDSFRARREIFYRDAHAVVDLGWCIAFIRFVCFETKASYTLSST